MTVTRHAIRMKRVGFVADRAVPRAGGPWTIEYDEGGGSLEFRITENPLASIRASSEWQLLTHSPGTGTLAIPLTAARVAVRVVSLGDPVPSAFVVCEGPSNPEMARYFGIGTPTLGTDDVLPGGPLLPAAIPPCVQPANYLAAVLGDSPIGYWRLNDAGPPTALDVSGNSRDGTYIGANFTFQAPGPFGIGDCSAEWSPIATEEVDIPDVAFDIFGAAGQEFTFEIWARPRSGSSFTAAFEKTTLGGALWNSLAVTGDAKLTWQLLSGSNPFVKSLATVNNGIWQHWVAMRTLTSGVHGADEIRLYVDGTLQGTAATSALFDSSNTRNLQIGQRDTGGGGAGAFNGWLAHAAVYNYALSAAQVSSHYTIGTTSP